MTYTYMEILNGDMSYMKLKNSSKRFEERTLFVYVSFGELYYGYFSMTQNIHLPPR
jgi:hypothetical protein